MSKIKRVILYILLCVLLIMMLVFTYILFLAPYFSKKTEVKEVKPVETPPLVVPTLPVNPIVEIETMPEEQFDLYEILRSKDTEKLKRFLSKEHIDLNTPFSTINNETPVMIAARIGFVDGVSLLVKEKLQLDLQDNSGKTALHHAVYSKYLESVKILLRKKALIDIRNKYGETPLIIATQNNDLFTVKLLLRYSPDIHASKNLKEGNAIAIAYRKKFHTIVNALYGKGAIHPEDNDSILLFIEDDDVKGVQNALASSVNPNFEEIEGRSLLLKASSYGNLKIIKLLLKYGSKLNFVGSKNYTPFLAALYYRRFEVVEYLLSLPQLNLNILHISKRNPLMMGIWKEAPNHILKILLQKTRNINAQDVNQWTALMFAAYSNNEVIVRDILNRYGVQRNKKNKDNRTAFDIAINKKHKSIAALLKR